MSSRTTDVDVVVVGAGLAGLAAADHLTRSGLSTRLIEARDRPGGRVRAERGLQVGGEFVGRPHTLLHALLARLDLRLRTTLTSGPVVWRTGQHQHASRLPRIPPRELTSAARALARVRRDSLALNPQAPWSSPLAARLDAMTVPEYLASQGAGPTTTQLLRSLVEGFATAPASQLSALQLAWWIARSGGLIATLASGGQAQISGGADLLPTRYADLLGATLATPIAYECSLTAVHAGVVGARSGREQPVELTTSGGNLTARAAVLALPLPALRGVVIDPVLSGSTTGIADELEFGTAVKISAQIDQESPEPREIAAVGGAPLAVAWRVGRTLSGIAPVAGLGHDQLLDDLLDIFGTSHSAVVKSASHDWSEDRWTGGSYLTLRPKQLTQIGPALQRHDGQIAFAAAERSSWPNSMEGALESGFSAAAHVADFLGKS